MKQQIGWTQLIHHSTATILLLMAVALCISSVQAQEPQPTTPQRPIQPVDASGLGTPLMMMNNQQKDSLKVFNYTEMRSATKKILAIKVIPPDDTPCTNPLTLKKAVLNARLKMGAIDYEFGLMEDFDPSSFNAIAVVTFVAYTTLPNTPPYTYSCTLQIQSGADPALVEPEQQWHQDFTTDYSDIDHIDVTVTLSASFDNASGNIITALKNATVLEVWYTDEFYSKVKNATNPGEPMIEVNPLSNTVSNNPVTFTWKLLENDLGDPPNQQECPNDKFYNYQFQLLRLFNRNLAKAIEKKYQDIIDTIDWSRALTIETGSYKKEITLTIPEGEGYYVWRVRPIGSVFPGGIADDRNWGLWTDAPANGELAIADIEKSNVDANYKNAIFFYNQFDKDKNWIYSRTFTEGEEGTRVSEKITYATRLLQPIQTQTHLQSKGDVVVTQSVLDYSGRPAVSSLPVPITGNGFSYQSNLLKYNSALYTAANFDANNNNTVAEPQPINNGLLHTYYSDNNSDLSVPNAEGYGYTRTMWYPDASGRVREQSSVGFVHRKQVNNSHTVRYWYAQPSDDELIAMFGDEAPEANAVQRVSVKDANGVISVKYVGKDGVTLATALGKGSNSAGLAELTEPAFDKTVNDTVKTKTARGNGEITGSKVIQLLNNSSITVKYQITPKTIEQECGEYCGSCDYEIEFRLFNTDNLSTLIASQTVAIKGKNLCPPDPLSGMVIQFVPQAPGTYLVERIIRPKKDDNGRDWIDNHRENTRQEVLNQLNTNGIFATVKQSLMENDLDAVWSYLHSAANLTYSGVTKQLNDQGAIISYTLITPCCTLEIPYQDCTDPNECPINDYYTSDTDLDFEGMLYDRWGSDWEGYKDPNNPNATPTHFGDNPEKYFRRDGGSLFPNSSTYSNGKGAFNELIKNMLAATNANGTPVYNCRKIYDIWTELVMNFGTLATKKGDQNPNDLDDDFDLLETFLSRTGRILEGISNCPYGNCSGTYDYGKGYITHAHRYFEYVKNGQKNNRSEDCERLYRNGAYDMLIDNLQDQDEHWVFNTLVTWPQDELEYDLDDPTNKRWEKFYGCVRQKGEKPKSLENKLPCDDADENCIKNFKEAIEDTCNTACERRYKSFIRSIERAYREVGQTPEGDKYTPTGGLVDSLTVVVPRAKIECQALTLVAECKEGCGLTITRDPDNKITGVGTESEVNAMRKAMYYSYRVSIPNGAACPDSMSIIKGTDADAWGRYMVRVLNDSLRRYRQRGGDANSAATTCEWIHGMLDEMFGEGHCQWDCQQIQSLLGSGQQSNEKSNSAMLLDEPPPSACTHPEDPCPVNQFPDIFTLDETITAEFAFEDCALTFYSTCNRPGYTPCVQYRGLCHDICTRVCSDSICFTWVPLHAPDTGTILRPVLCAERVCKQVLTDINQQIANCLDKAEAAIAQQYQTNCRLPESLQDQMIITYDVDLYHFTLFYHDRAGNLVKTIPPLGVDLSSINRTQHPNHTFATAYVYNSLKQLLATATPDGGGTMYAYDDKGRLRFSQDQRQRDGNRPEGLPPIPPTSIPITYSYTKYDLLGRVVESGEALLDPILRGTGMPVPINEVNAQDFPQYGQRTFTRTIYSTPVPSLNYLRQTNRGQRYVRNRVSYTITEANIGTFYSYDPHGNVEWMASHLPGLGMNFVGYEYDLIGGKMLRVLYDSGMGDMFAHRYRYDEDNRLLTAETSRDGVLWDRDAEQEYYRHGPLRRLELGEDSIQGIDYTYTIHGWLKGINHAMLTSTSDPGLDGSFSNGMKYPLDGFGMVLGYYAGDYVRRYGSGGGNTKYSEFTSKQGGGYKQAPDQIAGTNLYNGNIASWRHQSQYGVGMAPVKYPGEVGNVYSYDVLNRLLGSEFRVNSGGNTWNGLNLNPPLGAGYSEDFTYDANGNILTAVRDGVFDPVLGSTLMDNLSYQYDYSPTINGPHRNRLRYVSDGVATTQTLSDLENQAAGFPPASPLPITGGRNYEYDGSGNLVYDRSEGTLIKWNAQGKVAEVRKDQLGVSQTTKFWYNAAGNRVKKQVINHLATDPEESSVTYYVRDANEAVMAIYQQTVFHASGTPGCLRKPNNGGMDMDMDGVVDAGCDKCTNGVPPTGGSSWNPWQEDYDQDGLGDACDPCPFIFGSVCDPQQPGFPAMPEMWTGVATTTKLSELPIYGSERLGLMRPNVLRDTVIVINPTPSIFTRRVDQKEYELKDHLGNVRVVVSDMKKRVGDLTATFTLRVKSVNNYYAFGMLEEGMSGSSEGYRYGYNGKEMDNELKGVGNSLDYGARMYDPRLGRWGSVDVVLTPYQNPYHFASNSSISRIDVDGQHDYYYNNKGDLVGFVYSFKNEHNVYVATALGKSTFNDVNYTLIGTLSKALPVMVKHADPTFMGKVLGERLISLPNGYKEPIQGTYLSTYYFVDDDGNISIPATLIPENVIPGVDDYWADEHLTPEQSAENALSALESELGASSHFYSRHGAQTTLVQQHIRATTGMTPDGKQKQPVNSTKFLSHVGQLNAVADVTAQFQNNHSNASQTGTAISAIGVGFYSIKHSNKPLDLASTFTYQAFFNAKTKSLITLFPVLPQSNSNNPTTSNP